MPPGSPWKCCPRAGNKQVLSAEPREKAGCGADTHAGRRGAGAAATASAPRRGRRAAARAGRHSGSPCGTAADSAGRRPPRGPLARTGPRHQPRPTSRTAAGTGDLEGETAAVGATAWGGGPTARLPQPPPPGRPSLPPSPQVSPPSLLSQTPARPTHISVSSLGPHGSFPAGSPVANGPFLPPLQSQHMPPPCLRSRSPSFTTPAVPSQTCGSQSHPLCPKPARGADDPVRLFFHLRALPSSGVGHPFPNCYGTRVLASRIRQQTQSPLSARELQRSWTRLSTALRAPDPPFLLPSPPPPHSPSSSPSPLPSPFSPSPPLLPLYLRRSLVNAQCPSLCLPSCLENSFVPSSTTISSPSPAFYTFCASSGRT